MKPAQVRRLREMSALATAFSETSSDAILCLDAVGRVTHWNRSAERLFGWTAAEVIGRGIDLIVPPALRDAHRQGLRRLSEGGEAKLVGRSIEVPAITKYGQELPIELSLTAWPGPEGRPAGYGAIIRDLSERKAAEAELKRQRRFLDQILENLPLMLFVKDVATRQYRLLNRAGEEVIGRSRTEVIGRTDHELFPDYGAGYQARDAEASVAGCHMSESEFRGADGRTRLLRTRRVTTVSEHGDPDYIIGITEDITERREAQARIAHLAEHDFLTGLANRAVFADQLAAAAAADRAAVLCIDLDRFKSINDVHGHSVGDSLLVTVGDQLKRLAGADDLVARLGGDEFAIICTGADADYRAGCLAEAIVAEIAKPYRLGGRVAHVGASIGVALCPADGRQADELVQHADLALYRAKSEGGGRFCFFERAMDKAAHERRELEADLRVAVADGSVGLAFQPLANLASGRISGFEALARWHHPVRGQIPPDRFIAVAEESGLIVELGLHILRLAAAEAARWQPKLRIAVNLSPLQFQHGDFAADVEAVLNETGLEPERLELEITEGVLIRDAERALATLTRLKSLGVRIAMDDFGTGYSSLSYFRQFPFDKVKIDQSFVREMDTNKQALAVVQAVIGLGRGLGMPIVAEGVETQAQLENLISEGCDEVQGYLIARPGPIDNFVGVVLDRGGEPAAAVRAA